MKLLFGTAAVFAAGTVAVHGQAAACPTLSDILEYEVPKIATKDFAGIAKDFERCDESIGVYLTSITPSFIRNKVNIEALCEKNSLGQRICSIEVTQLAAVAYDLGTIIMDALKAKNGTGRLLIGEDSPVANEMNAAMTVMSLQMDSVAAHECPHSLLSLAGDLVFNGIDGLFGALEACDGMTFETFFKDVVNVPNWVEKILKFLKITLPTVDEFCTKNTVSKIVCAERVDIVADFFDQLIGIIKTLLKKPTAPPSATPITEAPSATPITAAPTPDTPIGPTGACSDESLDQPCVTRKGLDGTCRRRRKTGNMVCRATKHARKAARNDTP